jgi:uncharacterized membrane protein SpoIIM required for sporulation
MIIDVARFQQREQMYWDELQTELDAQDRDAARSMPLERALRLHYLYRRAASDLNELRSLPGEVELRVHLEALVARAYAEIHDTRRYSHLRRMGHWFTRGLPQTFRRRSQAFAASLMLMLAGASFGAGVVAFDYDSKGVLLPFPHLKGDPAERVAFEEAQKDDPMEGAKSTFSAQLMANNIRVSILALALGMTFGIGTTILLFYNGVILGAVAFDYVQAGQGTFLLGWLLPHGSVEIPAILIAGQGGLLLARGLIGWGDSLDMRSRLRSIRPDLVTLIIAVALLLVWAGIVESFFSQYHEPLVPYWLKIAFGAVQLTLLFGYLLRAGRNTGSDSEPVR